MRKIIHTESAPKAIGTYSQAVQVDNVLYLSGQIPLDPRTMSLVSDDFTEQTHRVFKNLKAVAEAAKTSLNEAVKLTIYLTEMKNFSIVNQIMGEYFSEPYPARATVAVAELPRGALIEIDAVIHAN